ncbi:P-loop NTPase fold protein [Curtobacterium sp. MCPF17_051]|uniref:P-loop NTPase fold protein n=1 Tax=Curtobacterium sp. MCPF17_051 TaxID=2175640 RepID=UPI000DA731BC|nr:P-loop NTPase fold protein [Curtobacterium sp. MCPF17_051]PZF28210.1 hypothetical protein DEJ35_12695 [Curtobacterium sp. MCPF17_051]
MSSTSYFSDDPISSDDADRLTRGPFVQQVIGALNAAASAGSSSVFGLIGPWGSGKTSILHLVETELHAQPRAWQVARFNPWAYPDEAAIQLGFFEELHAALPDSEKTRSARKAIARLSRSIAPVAGIMGAFTGVDGAAAMHGIADLVDVNHSATRAYKEAAAALREAPAPVLVVMDDLDRLDPQELVLVAKLVRLVGRLPNVFYLLSYDETTLLDVLTRTPLVGARQHRAKDYLEKIVQVRLDLPPLRPDQAAQLVSKHLEALEERLGLALTALDRDRFDRVYNEAIARRLRTVRSISRFFAQLGVLTPDVARDVDVIDFLLLTWIRVAEPRVYAMVYDHREWTLGTQPKDPWATAANESDGKTRHDDLIARLERTGVAASDASDVAFVLGALFPAVRSDLVEQQARYASGSADLEPRRVSNPDYFHRYFAYLVPENDVSDQLIDRAVEVLNDGGFHPAALDDLARILRSHSALVSRKLQERQPNATAFTSWLIDHFIPSDVDDEFRRWTLFPLIRWAMLRLPTSTFPLILTQLQASDGGRRVAIEFGSSLESGRDFTAMYGRVPIAMVEQRWLEMQAALPGMLVAELRDQRPAGALEADVEYMQMLFLWDAIEPGAAKRWLRTQWVDGDWRLLDILARFVPTMQSSANPGISLLRRTDQGLLTQLFDPEDIAAALGADIDNVPALSPSTSAWPATNEHLFQIALNDARDFVATHRKHADGDSTDSPR